MSDNHTSPEPAPAAQPEFCARTLLEAVSVPSFRKASWAGIKKGSTRVDSTNGLNWVVKVRGALDFDALERAYLAVIARHDALRASIIDTEQGPYLFFQPQVSWCLQRIDLSDVAAEMREARARELASSLVWMPFDLSQAPLFRAFVITLGPREHVLGLVAHHFIADGTSREIIKREVLLAYQAYSHQQVPRELAEPCVQYSGYLMSMERWFASPAATPHFVYWKERLARAPAVILPDSMRDSTTVRTEIKLGAELTSAIYETARALRVTPYFLLCAAQYVLLSKLTELEDVTIGSVIQGRETPALQPVVGNLADRVYHRVSLVGNPRFAELVQRVRTAVMEAESHQFVRFDILTRIRGDEGLVVAPMFNYMPGGPAEAAPPAWNEADESVTRFPIAPAPVNTPGGGPSYWLTMWWTSDGLEGNFRFWGRSMPAVAPAFAAVLAQAVRWTRLRLRSFALN